MEQTGVKRPDFHPGGRNSGDGFDPNSSALIDVRLNDVAILSTCSELERVGFASLAGGNFHGRKDAPKQRGSTQADDGQP